MSSWTGINMDVSLHSCSPSCPTLSLLVHLEQGIQALFSAEWVTERGPWLSLPWGALQPPKGTHNPKPWWLEAYLSTKGLHIIVICNTLFWLTFFRYPPGSCSLAVLALLNQWFLVLCGIFPDLGSLQQDQWHGQNLLRPVPFWEPLGLPCARPWALSASLSFARAAAQVFGWAPVCQWPLLGCLQVLCDTTVMCSILWLQWVSFFSFLVKVFKWTPDCQQVILQPHAAFQALR